MLLEDAHTYDSEPSCRAEKSVSREHSRGSDCSKREYQHGDGAVLEAKAAKVLVKFKHGNFCAIIQKAHILLKNIPINHTTKTKQKAKRSCPLTDSPTDGDFCVSNAMPCHLFPLGSFTDVLNFPTQKI